MADDKNWMDWQKQWWQQQARRQQEDESLKYFDPRMFSFGQRAQAGTNPFGGTTAKDEGDEPAIKEGANELKKGRRKMNYNAFHDAAKDCLIIECKGQTMELTRVEIQDAADRRSFGSTGSVEEFLQSRVRAFVCMVYTGSVVIYDQPN